MSDFTIEAISIAATLFLLILIPFVGFEALGWYRRRHHDRVARRRKS